MGWIDPRLDWNSTHFYNFEDLNRVEINTSVIAELLNYFIPVPGMTFNTDRDMKNITFADSLSRIENNQILLRQRYLPAGWLHRASAGSDIEKLPRLIQGSAADVQLDNIDLNKNKNLLKNSGFLQGLNGWMANGITEISLVGDYLKATFNTDKSTPGIRAVPFSPLPVGTYILTARVNTDGMTTAPNLYWISGTNSVGFPTTNNTGKGWIEIQAIFTVPIAGSNYIYLLTSTPKLGTIMLVDWMQLKEGSVATPWQPAPEDGFIWYQTSKVVNLPGIDLSSLDQYEYSVFKWDAVTPTGTKVNVEYSLDKVTWKEIKNNQGLSFANGDWMVGKTLYIRQTLSTTDQAVTPTLKNFTYTLNGYQKEVKWSPNDPFSYRDAFRLENNMNLLYKHYKGNTEIVPICGAYICGEAVI